MAIASSLRENQDNIDAIASNLKSYLQKQKLDQDKQKFFGILSQLSKEKQSSNNFGSIPVRQPNEIPQQSQSPEMFPDSVPVQERTPAPNAVMVEPKISERPLTTAEKIKRILSDPSMSDNSHVETGIKGLERESNVDQEIEKESVYRDIEEGNLPRNERIRKILGLLKPDQNMDAIFKQYELENQARKVEADRVKAEREKPNKVYIIGADGKRTPDIMTAEEMKKAKEMGVNVEFAETVRSEIIADAASDRQDKSIKRDENKQAVALTEQQQASIKNDIDALQKEISSLVVLDKYGDAGRQRDSQVANKYKNIVEKKKQLGWDTKSDEDNQQVYIKKSKGKKDATAKPAETVKKGGGL